MEIVETWQNLATPNMIFLPHHMLAENNKWKGDPLH